MTLKITIEIDATAAKDLDQFLARHGQNARQFFELAIGNQMAALNEHSRQQREANRFKELNDAARQMRRKKRESH